MSQPPPPRDTCRVTPVLTSALAFLLFLPSLGNNGRHASSVPPLCLPLTPTRGSRVSVCPYSAAVRRKKPLSNSIISILYRASQHPLPVPRSSSNLVDFILILHLCCAVVLGLLWCFYCVGQNTPTSLYLFLPSVVVKPFGTSALTQPPVVKRSIAPESPNPDVHLCNICSSEMVLKEKVERKIHILKLNELS